MAPTRPRSPGQYSAELLHHLSLSVILKAILTTRGYLFHQMQCKIGHAACQGCCDCDRVKGTCPSCSDPSAPSAAVRWRPSSRPCSSPAASPTPSARSKVPYAGVRKRARTRPPTGYCHHARRARSRAAPTRAFSSATTSATRTVLGATTRAPQSASSGRQR